MKSTMEKREGKRGKEIGSGRVRMTGGNVKCSRVRADLMEQRNKGFKGTISVNIRKKNVLKGRSARTNPLRVSRLGEEQETTASCEVSKGVEGRKGSQG